MSKKIIYIVVGVIVLVGVFYGGMVFGKSQVQTTTQSTQTFGQNGTFTRGNRGGGAGFGGGTAGQIISKDAISITISLPSGGSKIILLDKSTPITKQASGTLADLAVGTNVSVVGSANQDGSMTAQAVQIRPNLPRNTTPPANVVQ
jgi:pectate lyase